MNDSERRRHGVERLPFSLGEALDRLERASDAGTLLPGELLEAYVMHKRGELEGVSGLTPEEVCRRYRDVY